MLTPVFSKLNNRFLIAGKREQKCKVWRETSCEYFEILDKENLLQWAFISGSIKTERDFLDMVNSRDNTIFFIFDSGSGSLAAMCQLSNNIGQTWMMHFSVLSKYHGTVALTLSDQVNFQICMLTMDSESSLSGKTSFVHTMLGLTPCPNRAAINFLVKSGFRKIKLIERAYYWARRKKYVDAVLSEFVNPFTKIIETHPVNSSDGLCRESGTCSAHNAGFSPSVNVQNSGAQL